MKELKEMKMGDWVSKYKPIQNLNYPNSSFDGMMFETYGEEIEYVCEQPKNKVWTIVVAEGEMYIEPGIRVVNRVGFFVTEIPYTETSNDFVINVNDA